HPPTSTLFPYTTLFRSAKTSGTAAYPAARPAAPAPNTSPERRKSRLFNLVSVATIDRPPIFPPSGKISLTKTHLSWNSGDAKTRDRKSTRLNSSHDQIS